MKKSLNDSYTSFPIPIIIKDFHRHIIITFIKANSDFYGIFSIDPIVILLFGETCPLKANTGDGTI
jgi:hypothetical protein